MSEKLQPVRGTKDLFNEEFLVHKRIIDTAASLTERYGYLPLATPIFEFTEVFKRTLGEVSDVVSKEMYTFDDRGGRSLTLRPEFTAAIMRAVISNGWSHQFPVKFFSTGPVFRYERPERARMRQFHQINAECVGISSPFIDCEVIALAHHILTELGISGHISLELNSLGDKESRDAYRKALVDYLQAYRHELSEDSKIRLEKNPLRILDSKDANDRKIIKDAPICPNYYTTKAQDFFARVKEGLAALNIRYVINPYLVRGLDYYCHTIFEFVTDQLGSQGTVLAGGRYDGLLEMMGGPQAASVGFAAGIERLAELMAYTPEKTRPLAIVTISDAYYGKMLAIADQLRHAGYIVECLYDKDIGKKMKRANKINARAAIFLGEEEIEKGAAKVRDLDSSEEKFVSLDKLVTELADFKA